MERPSEIRVVSAVADKKQAILYLEDGNQIILKQGDHRLGDLLDIIIPITARGETAVVSLEDFSIYAAFEKKTSGLTRFFKVAKDKVKGFFGGQTETHKAVIPEEGKLAVIKAVMGESMTEDEVLTHGEPVNLTDDVGPDEVVVAIVTTPAKAATQTTKAVPERKAVIPGVQNLKPLIDHAVKSNSAEAVQNFLTRCAAFIDKRQHSVDDLMRFLEKGDLPLAEDGSIIAYKMLNWMDQSKGIMKDCHSGNIPQKVGSYVCVNENLVDLNRRTECSNGLHIARRGYLKSFSGQVCVICKIDPEDVMVVPHNDANKVRVKGYHILGILTEDAKIELMNNRPATSDNQALKLIYDAIKGMHVDRLERVQVNGQMGSKVKITPIKGGEQREAPHDLSADQLKAAQALDSEKAETGAVDVREINKRVTEAMNTPVPADDIEGVEDEEDDDNEVEGSGDDEADESTSPTHGDYQGEHADEPDDIEKELEEATKEALGNDVLDQKASPADPQKADAFFAKPKSIREQMANLILDYQTTPTAAEGHKVAQAIMALKKSSKQGWFKLGVDLEMGKLYEQTAGTVPAPEIKVATKTKPEVGTKEKKGVSIKSAGTPLLGSAKEPSKVATTTVSKTPTKAEQARDLFTAGKMDELKSFRKRAKKGWEAFGFSSSEIKKIEGK